MSREQIQRLVEEAKKNKPIRPTEIKTYKSRFDRSEEIQKYPETICNTILQKARDEIAIGRIPIIFLPDTKMRTPGILFHSALMTAFPEIYGPKGILMKHMMGPIHFLEDVQHRIFVPEYFKKIKNLSIITVDLFTQDVDSEKSPRANKIKDAITNLNPNAQVSFLNVGEHILNPFDQPISITKDNQKYNGHGRVLKQTNSYNPNLPTRLRVKIQDLINKYPDKRMFLRRLLFKRKRPINRSEETTYWQELDLRKQYRRLGLQLGTEFKFFNLRK